MVSYKGLWSSLQVSFVMIVEGRFDVKVLVASSSRTWEKHTALAIIPQRQIYHIYKIGDQAPNSISLKSAAFKVISLYAKLKQMSSPHGMI